MILKMNELPAEEMASLFDNAVASNLTPVDMILNPNLKWKKMSVEEKEGVY